MAATTYLNGTLATLLSTELNGTTNNELKVGGAAYSGAAGYVLAELELLVSYAVAPAVGAGVAVWFLRSIDGTNFEDGSTTVTPASPPDVVFPLRAVTGAQRVPGFAFLPPGEFKTLAKNDAVGTAMAATGNVLRILPSTFQS